MASGVPVGLARNLDVVIGVVGQELIDALVEAIWQPFEIIERAGDRNIGVPRMLVLQVRGVPPRPAAK